MHQPANAQLLAQAGMLNQLFDEKAFSWTLAMEDLETVLPGGVQVTTLEPARAKDGHITLRLRVMGPRDRDVELVQNLEHSRRFLLPRIVGENASRDRRPEPAPGAGERLEPLRLRSAGRVQPGYCRRVEQAKRAPAKQRTKPERWSMRACCGSTEPGAALCCNAAFSPMAAQTGRPPFRGPIKPPPFARESCRSSSIPIAQQGGPQ